MTNTAISFLYFDGCPLAARARKNLVDAIQIIQTNSRLSFEDIDLMSPETSDDLKRWGSPTILVNGEDITGAKRGSACSCRLYASDGGVPTVPEIIEAIDSRFSK